MSDTQRHAETRGPPPERPTRPVPGTDRGAASAVTVAVIVEASGAAQAVGAVWLALGAWALSAQRGRVRVQRSGAASALRARKTTALRAKNACGLRVSGGR
jgi:hypothetical protein